jgi:hypothetical protein
MPVFRTNSTTGRNIFYKLTRGDSHIKVAEYTDLFFFLATKIFVWLQDFKKLLTHLYT